VSAADRGLNGPAKTLLSRTECRIELVSVPFAQDQYVYVPNGPLPGLPFMPGGPRSVHVGCGDPVDRLQSFSHHNRDAEGPRQNFRKPSVVRAGGIGPDEPRVTQLPGYGQARCLHTCACSDELFRAPAHCARLAPLRSRPVNRIAIIGCGGSGKSHIARELGVTLGITPVHLDTLYYDKDWNPLPKEEFAALQRDLVSAPQWVIDGNYASSLPIRLQSADTVIFLDLPARTCLRGILQRRLRHGGGQHDAIGIYDRITVGFVRYIIGYRRTMAPRVRSLIAEHACDAEVTVLRSRRAARRYLATATGTVRAPAPARALPVPG